MTIKLNLIIERLKRLQWQVGNNWLMVDGTGLMFYLWFMKKPIFINFERTK